MRNFINAAREGEKQNSPIKEGYIANLLCHPGNYSKKLGRELMLDTSNGHVLNDKEAMEYWSREYEPGWEMKL